MELLPLIFLWLGGFAAGAAAGYVFNIIKSDPRDDDDDDDDDPNVSDSSPPESVDYYFDNRDTHK